MTHIVNTHNDTACRVVTAALAKVPNAQAQLDSLRGAMRMGGGDTTVRTRMAAIYQRAGVNADTARACMRRAGANRAGGAGTGASGGTGGAGGGAQVVFVKEGLKWAPQGVRLGVSDFDYSEVLSGAKEGDVVALLGAAVLQAQRDQASDRARAITGNGLPGSGATGGGGRGGGARGCGGAGGGRRP